jgi:hypothetical protein
MKHYLLVVAVFFVLVGCSPSKKNVSGERAGVSVIEESGRVGKVNEQLLAVEAKATVEKVDLKNRKVTLKLGDGSTETLPVSDQVKRLGEIKRGDTVVVSYLQSIAWEVRKPTEAELKNPKTIIEIAGKSPADLPPGAMVAKNLQAIVTVVEIHRATQTVTVKGPTGRLVSVRLQDAESIRDLKVGDTAAVSYTEAVAISIDPVAKG